MNDHDNQDDQYVRTDPLTPQEAALQATLATRVAGYSVQRDLLLLRSMAREIEQQQA